MQFPHLAVLLAAAGIAAAVPFEGNGASLEARQLPPLQLPPLQLPPLQLPPLQLPPVLSCPATTLFGFFPLNSAAVTASCLSLVNCLVPAAAPAKLPGLSNFDLSQLDQFKCTTACTCKGGATATTSAASTASATSTATSTASTTSATPLS